MAASKHPDAPDYDVDVDADELLADLAENAADYGEKYVEHRRWWRNSLDAPTPFHDARYWMMEAWGALRAYSEALAHLQPDGRFRNDDDTVDVRGFMAWLSRASEDAHERSYGDYTETRQADEAESAYSRMASTLRDDYGVGWPRMDDLGGVIEEDLP